MCDLREPTNNDDFETKYEHIIHWLQKASAPSNVLGYAADLYKIAEGLKEVKAVDKNA